MCLFFQAEDGIRDRLVTGVQTCALPILNITLTGKDAAGNEALPHSLEKVKYDTTRPTLSMLNPLSDVFINYKTISYELDENIKEALLMVTQTGGVFDSRSPQNIQLLSKELKEGKKEHIQLINEPLLENGSIYSFQFSGKDFAGNELHPVSITNISYDNEPPTLSISQPIDSEQIKNSEINYVLSDNLSKGIVIYKQTGGTTDPNSPHEVERSEEHTSELQSQAYLVCRLLLEKKKQTTP